MTTRTTCLAAALAALCCAPAAHAQYLYSQSFNYPGGRLALSLKLNLAQPSTTHTVTVSASPLLIVTAPGVLVTDGRGFGSIVASVQRTAPVATPQTVTITVAHPSLPNGQLTRKYTLRVVGGELTSAWPELLMLQGVFCNPANAASTQLEIDRMTDLDGDGIYGDVNLEGGLLGKDPIDFPSEFASDNNAIGTLGCYGGNPGGIFWPGSAGRTVAWCTDNRIVLGACSFTSAMNFIEDMSFAKVFNGKPALLVTSSGSDLVMIVRDANGDGSIGAGEINTFFDPNALVSAENYSPDGVAIDPTAGNRAYWISDKSGATGPVTNMGIWRLVDANNDDKIGAGEFTPSWTGTVPAVQVEAQMIDHSEFECLHVDSQGGVLVNQTTLGTIFRWRDANLDGVAQTGEVSNWLTYNKASTLTVSADFQLPNFPVLAGPFWAMNLIESIANVAPGNREVYFVGWTNSTGIGAGFVFRCEDKNSDGDVNDAGEVTIFNDPSQIMDLYPPNFISGLDAYGVDENANGTIENNEVYVWLAAPNGPKPNCGYTLFNDLNIWRMHDVNGDGDAVDLGEYDRVAVHPTGAFNRGLEVVPGELDGGYRPTFYQRSGLLTLQTGGCLTAANEYMELDFRREKIEEGTQGTPFASNARFEIITRGNGTSAVANSGLLLGVTLASTPFPIGPCSLWLLPPFYADLIPAAVPDANGVARFPIPIPGGIAGYLYLQPFSLQGTQVYLGEVGELRIQ